MGGDREFEAMRLGQYSWNLFLKWKIRCIVDKNDSNNVHPRQKYVSSFKEVEKGTCSKLSSQSGFL